MEVEDLCCLLDQVRNIVWTPLLFLLLGVGIYLTFLLRGVQFRYLGYAIKQVFAKQQGDSKGDISHFESLMTSLAGAIGTGTIVGVTTAVTIGGLGALFWMWVTAFFGMATKYAESLLAVKYRELDSRGEMSGGPMQYIERGLGWKWMASLFAIFGGIAAIGTGNLVQVNSIADAVANNWLVDPWVTGLVVAALTGLVIMGGVRSIGHVAGVLVPLMAVLYIGGGLIIIGMHLEHIPDAFAKIMEGAFQGKAAVGGVAGTGILMTVIMGVSRSVFSNEAGMGISSIAAAAAKTDSPSRQALVIMTGALLSTIIVCSITGLVLAVTGVLDEQTEGVKGAGLAIKAFKLIPGGDYIVAIGLILFAFSTVIAWAYYGEKCCEYLFGASSIYFYRLLFTLLVIPGAALKIEVVWGFADIMNGLMIIPNLIALIALSSVLTSETCFFVKTINSEAKANHGV